MDDETRSLVDELRQLRAELEHLRGEVATLRAETASLRAADSHPPGEDRVTSGAGGRMRRPMGRRAAISSALAVAAGGVMAACARPSSTAAAAPTPTPPPAATSQGLQPLMNFGAPLDALGDYPPLDSSVTWSRLQRQTTPGSTSELLSLIMEAEGAGAFPWPLYVQLVSRTDSAGQATGTYVRMFNEEAGWAASYHTDLYHLGTGTSIGTNVELTRTASTTALPGGSYPALPAQPAGRAIGLNIQNTDNSTVDGDQAVNIQGGPGRSWETAVNIEDQNSGTDGVAVGGQWQNAVHLKGTGSAALTIDGQYGSGITLLHNDIRISSGSRLYLDDAGDVYLQYDATHQAIQFVYGPKGVVASIDVLRGTVSGV